MEARPKYTSSKIKTRSERKESAESNYTNIRVYMGKETLRLLNEISKDKKLPVSRLICFAIDKEFDREDAFQYNVPEQPLVRDHEYANEAGILYKFLLRKANAKGVGLDIMMLIRRDIGIADKLRLVGAYYELLRAGMIKETYPYGQNYAFDFAYKVARVVREYLK